MTGAGPRPSRRRGLVLLGVGALTASTAAGAAVGVLGDGGAIAEAVVLVAVTPEQAPRQEQLFETYAVQVTSLAFVEETAHEVGIDAEDLADGTTVERVGGSDALRIRVSAPTAPAALRSTQRLADRLVDVLAAEDTVADEEALVRSRLEEVNTALAQRQQEVAGQVSVLEVPTPAAVQVRVAEVTSLQQEASALQLRLVDLELEAVSSAGAGRVLDVARLEESSAVGQALRGGAAGLAVGLVAVLALAVSTRAGASRGPEVEPGPGHPVGPHDD